MIYQKAKLYDGNELVADNLKVVCESVPNTIFTHSCYFSAPTSFQPDLGKTYNLFFEKNKVSTRCQIDSFEHTELNDYVMYATIIEETEGR